MTPQSPGIPGRIPPPQGCRASLRPEGDILRAETSTSRDGTGEGGIPAGLSSLIDALIPRQAEPEDCWQDQALCAQVDPELFFPEKGGSTKYAKDVCRACPVISECLEYAMDRNERYGIYGGMSERDRRRLKWRRIA